MMRILVLFGAVTFFARCFDQAQPYWRVISGANKRAQTGQHPTGESGKGP